MLLVSLMLLTGCRTRTVLASKVAIGMSKEQVIKICGKPHKQSAKYDEQNNLIEVLFYKETTWPDGGWSGVTTITNHMFVFKNGTMIAIEQGDDVHKKSSYSSVYVF